MTVRVNNRPVARAGDDVHTSLQTITFNGSGSIKPDGDPLTMTWDFGHGSSKVQGVTVNHTYSKGGRYPVMLGIHDGLALANSSSSSTLTVDINQTPSAMAGPDRQTCAGDVVIFDSSASADPEGGLLR